MRDERVSERLTVRGNSCVRGVVGDRWATMCAHMLDCQSIFLDHNKSIKSEYMKEYLRLI